MILVGRSITWPPGKRRTPGRSLAPCSAVIHWVFSGILFILIWCTWAIRHCEVLLSNEGVFSVAHVLRPNRKQWQNLTFSKQCGEYTVGFQQYVLLKLILTYDLYALAWLAFRTRHSGFSSSPFSILNHIFYSALRALWKPVVSSPMNFNDVPDCTNKYSLDLWGYIPLSVIKFWVYIHSFSSFCLKVKSVFTVCGKLRLRNPFAA